MDIKNFNDYINEGLNGRHSEDVRFIYAAEREGAEPEKCLYLGPGPFRVTNTLVLFGDEKLLKELHKHIQSKKLQVSVAHYVKEYESN